MTTRLAATTNATKPRTSSGQSSETTSGGSGVVAPAVTLTTDETSATRIAPVDDAADDARDRDERGANAQVAAQLARRHSLRAQVEELAALVAQVGHDDQQQADEREHERRERRRAEDRERAARERIRAQLVQRLRVRRDGEAVQRRARELLAPRRVARAAPTPRSRAALPGVPRSAP